ncbi:MAG: hypothetical protein WBB28_03755 [Crinalium sp.]
MDLPELNNAVNSLVETIQGYESSTFEPPPNGLTHTQAERMAAHLINQLEVDLDGAMLTTAYLEISQKGN